ncbi:MAG: asparagine synthase-related protein [Egibacteraceae bacterium]
MSTVGAAVESKDRLLLHGLTSLEVAAGMVFGIQAETEPLPEPSLTPRAALEHAVLHGLERGPCVVSFSGGRDSSAVLALATDVARRHGLPLPVPVTLRFPECKESFESEWQEMVVRHLALDDWERVTITDELDLIGPYAARVLRRHGLVWPHNAHFHAPIFDRARGGSALTGIGGDELLNPRGWPRLALVLNRKTSPRPKDVLRLGVAVAPSFLRRKIYRYRYRGLIPRPWLRPTARRRLEAMQARDWARDSVRWDRSIRKRWWPSRRRWMVQETMATLAADAGATAIHPLEDGAFLSALASQVGSVGFRSRTEAMHHLFGDLLPKPVLSRVSKAAFTYVFWHRHSRAFASRWDGSGVDPALVHPDLLRSIWTQPTRQHPLTSSLFQSAWLEQRGSPSTADRFE